MYCALLYYYLVYCIVVLLYYHVRYCVINTVLLLIVYVYYQVNKSYCRLCGQVLQCVRGHVLCASCLSRLALCPVCRVPLDGPPIRNLALERLLRLL